MRAVIQRVLSATVTTDDEVISKIGHGLLVLLGIAPDDELTDIKWLTDKICTLRIFSDEKGHMNLSIVDVKGELMVISQFTLFASTKKGRRPSYIQAAKPDVALPIYQKTIALFEKTLKRPVAAGIFGAHMKVSLTNDGPITITIDTNNKE